MCAPFVTALYGALQGAKEAHQAKARDAPPGRAACRRFKSAATWLVALVSGGGDSPLPLWRDVSDQPLPQPDLHKRRVEVDASPWGGGGVLYVNDAPTSYFATRWRPEDITGLDVDIGLPRSQTFWEIVALFLALCLWARPGEALAVLGDNTAALQEALNLRGKRQAQSVSREMAVRKARGNWLIHVGHLPSEANTAADACSRLWAEGHEKKLNPFRGTDIKHVRAPRLSKLWSVRD